MMGDQDDPYITKLQALFMSCDPRVAGLLGHDQLQDLCRKLQLSPSQTKYVIDQLVAQDPFVKVDFDEFKEIFVKLLTMDNNDAIEESKDVTLLREYLRSTWTKLGLPENSYLSIEDLGFVCNEIGMADVSEEAIEQLFATLDRDKDGKVSFEELLTGMSSQQEMLTCKNDKKESREEQEEEVERTDRNFSSSPNFLVSLNDPNKDGLVSVETVTCLWKSLGFTDAKSILKDLGLIGSEINVQNLSDLLEEEVFSAVSSSHGNNVAQVAFATFRNEFNQLKVHLDQMSEERVKLKRSVAEANLRADLLAQEVDDHHRQLERSTQEKLMSLEKKHRERLNALEQELMNERELLSHQCLHLSQKLEKERLKWQENECRSKETIARLEQERNKISSDLGCWIEKCCQLETKNLELSKKVDESLSMTERLETKSEQHLDLERKVEKARNQCKKLQDLNDELILEVEKLKKELKGVPKSDDAVFDLKKKQKIDNSSWNEGATERKSHKKRHSVVTIFEERANQSETCNILHNLGTSSSNHLSSSDQMKGLEHERAILHPQNEPFGGHVMAESVSESHKMMTCTKFIEYLLGDLDEHSWPQLNQQLTKELIETCNTSKLIGILLQHLNRIRVKSSPRKGFFIKSTVSEKLITSLYLETTQQLKLIQELEMKLMRTEREKMSLNSECKYLNKVIRSQSRRDLKQ